ncbi:MAG: ATP-binding protein [Gemmatimonadaceae bacterium]
MPREVEATARHIGREAIRNALKHAHASVITVDVAYVDNALTLAVADDGIGMSGSQLELAAVGGHFGILGMRERAIVAGGALHISSKLGGATLIQLRLPALNA